MLSPNLGRTSKIFVNPWRPPIRSAKPGLLLGSFTSIEVAHAILAVELNANLAAEAGSSAVERPGLDARHVGHDLEFRVEAGAAVAAEEVLVDLARVAGGVPRLGGSYMVCW